MSDMDWAEIARDHGTRIYRAAREVTRDGSAAWDCVQEAFVTALGRTADTAPIEDPVAWLAGTARHHAMNHVRGRARFSRAIERLARRRETEPVPPPAAGIDDRELLFEALARLPSEQREAVSLRYLAGLGIAEIARAQGATEAAAKSRVRRGLKKLRRTLRPAVLLFLLVRESRAGGEGVRDLLARSRPAPTRSRWRLVVPPAALLVLVALFLPFVLSGVPTPAGPPAPPPDDPAPTAADGTGGVAAPPPAPDDPTADAPAPPSPSAPAPPPRQIRGRVVNAWGLPVPNATVALEGDAMLLAVTDWRGRFAIAGVPGKPMELLAGRAGWRTLRRPVAATDGDLGDVVLAGACSIVVRAELPDGAPAPGFRVAVVPLERTAVLPAGLTGGDPAAGFLVAPPSADRFALTDLPEGPLALVVAARDLSAVAIETVYPALADSVTVRLKPAGTARVPGPFPGDTPFLRLLGAAGAPAGTAVSWRLRVPAGAEALRVTLPAGRYSVWADPGVSSNPKRWQSAELAIQAGRETTGAALSLPANAGYPVSDRHAIRVRVLDAETRAPIHRIRHQESLDWVIPHGWLSSVGDGEGVHIVEDMAHFPQWSTGGGTPNHWFTAPGYDVTILDESDLALDGETEVLLRKGARVQARLAGARPGDRIDLYPGRLRNGKQIFNWRLIQETPWTSVPVAKDGSLELPAMPRGSWYAILETGDGIRCGLGFRTIDDGEDPEWEAPPRIPVRLHVERDASGLPAVPFVHVRHPELRGNFPGARRILPRLAAGGVTTLFVPAGEIYLYEHSAFAGDERATKVDSNPGAGGVRDLWLRPPARLEVRVRMPEGFSGKLHLTVTADRSASAQGSIPLDRRGRGIVDLPAWGEGTRISVVATATGAVLDDAILPGGAREIELTPRAGCVTIPKGDTEVKALLVHVSPAELRTTSVALHVRPGETGKYWLREGTWEVIPHWTENFPPKLEIRPGAEVTIER